MAKITPPATTELVECAVLFFLALSALAAATFGSVMLYQRGEERRRLGAPADPRLLLPERKSEPPPKASRQGEPTLETLDLGDIVEDGPDDWLVVGARRYREEQDTWALFALEGGDRQRLLEVRRRRGQLEVAFLDGVDDLPGGQLLQGLTYRQQSFTLEARGDARVTAEGEAQAAPASGRLAWARFGGAGGALLLVEDDPNGQRQGFYGQKVAASALSLMSGELNRDT